MIKTPIFIKRLIFVNIAVYSLCTVSSLLGFNLSDILGLVPYLFLKKYFIWQIFSYMFVHGGVLHLFFNMLMLWMFGIELYNFFGKNLFIKYYFICGIGAGISVLALSFFLKSSYYVPTVGASGAIFGLLLAYGWFFKDKQLYVFGIFPIKARPLVIILSLIELFSLLAQPNSNISHTAHLGGLVFGYFYLLFKEKQKISKQKKYQEWKEHYNSGTTNKEKQDITWN